MCISPDNQVGAGRPRPDTCGQDRTVFGSVFNVFRTLKEYHIWYLWKATNTGFNLALKFLISYVSIKSYGCLKKKLQKKTQKKCQKTFWYLYIMNQLGSILVF